MWCAAAPVCIHAERLYASQVIRTYTHAFRPAAAMPATFAHTQKRAKASTLTRCHTDMNTHKNDYSLVPRYARA